MKTHLAGLLAITALTITACAGPASAPEPQAATPPAAVPAAAYTPVVSLNEIMVYVVDPHSNELWDATVKAPASDEGWSALQRGAVAIAAAGSMTRMSGNGPNDQRWTGQADWAKHSQELADSGLAALAAVRAKDTVALGKAGDRLVLNCINCHREYKLDVPKIWTERQLPPEEQNPR